MNEILAVLAFCASVDVFEITKEEMTYIAGIPAHGLYLHGSIFIREDLNSTYKHSVYIHECVHAQQESRWGVAGDNRAWQLRECEAERVQQLFLGAHGMGIAGTCNYGSQ